MIENWINWEIWAKGCSLLARWVRHVKGSGARVSCMPVGRSLASPATWSGDCGLDTAFSVVEGSSGLSVPPEVGTA